MNAQEAAEAAGKISWFHSIDLGDGVVTPGLNGLETLTQAADSLFADGAVKDRSVLEIGVWDGFFSFEASRRGASKVLATDHFCWSGPGWGTKAGFDFARKHLPLEVEEMDIDVESISPDTVGHFDVVLFLGVLYHLQNPLLGLRRAGAVAREMMIFETPLESTLSFRPAMVFYPNDELGGGPTNRWGPNKKCVIEMLKSVGFKKVTFKKRPSFRDRGIFLATK